MTTIEQVRRDAALVARIYRARLDLGDRWERNRLARANARQLIRGWLFQNKEA